MLRRSRNAARWAASFVPTSVRPRPVSKYSGADFPPRQLKSCGFDVQLIPESVYASSGFYGYSDLLSLDFVHGTLNDAQSSAAMVLKGSGLEHLGRKSSTARAETDWPLSTALHRVP